MVCEYCNREIPEGSVFCYACGRKLSGHEHRHTGLKIYHGIMLALYGIALLTCFICNLAVGHTLSWFFIVLCSIGMGFCITNLPFMLKKHRLVLSAASVTVLLYLLLFVCNAYSHGHWLLRYAYPIVTYPVLLVWMMILVAKIRGLNVFYKLAVISLICAIAAVTISSWVSVILYGSPRSFGYYFLTQFGPRGHSYTGNAFVAIFFLACFIIGLILGMVFPNKGRRS